MKVTLVILALFISIISIGQEEDYYTKSDSTAKVTTLKGGVYTGTILSDNGKELEMNSDQVGLIIIAKTDIQSIEYTTTGSPDLIIPEQNSEVIIGEYGFGQTAFNTPQGKVAFQTHYFAFIDFDFGISDNFSLDIGASYPLLAPLKVGLKGSVDLANNLRIGGRVNAFMIVDYWNGGSGNSFITIPFALATNFTGMLTIGDQQRNLTIGGTYFTIPQIEFQGFGGYIGGYKRVSKSIGISGEVLYGQDDSENGTMAVGLFCKYHRAANKLWTFGLESPAFPRYSYNGPNYTRVLDGYLVIPIPYIGYRVSF